MLRGAIISESLKVGAVLDVPLTVTKMSRFEPADVTPEQPKRWTLMEFEAGDEHAETLAAALTGLLDTPGWYVDFHSDDEVFVVFAGRIFRYRRGDAAARAEVADYARTAGVPEPQLDWAE